MSDYIFNYKSSLKLLAKWRSEEREASQNLKDLRIALEESPEYQDWSFKFHEASGKTAELENTIKKEAIKNYEETKDKAVNAHVGIREMTKLEYELQKAVEFCKDKLPEAFKFDPGVFEKYVKAMEKISPVDFVKISKVPQATIATDLSEYLDEV